MTPIRQSGKTEDGYPVMAGVGLMATTHGVPLEIILAGFKDRGWVCDWLDYCKTCLKDGHKPQTVLSRATAALGDVYGPEYAKAVAERLSALISLLV